MTPSHLTPELDCSELFPAKWRPHLEDHEKNIEAIIRGLRMAHIPGME